MLRGKGYRAPLFEAAEVRDKKDPVARSMAPAAAQLELRYKKHDSVSRVDPLLTITQPITKLDSYLFLIWIFSEKGNRK